MTTKKIKIVYIISSLPNRAYAFEWLAGKIDPSRFDIAFILLNPGMSSFEHYLSQHSIPSYRVKWESRKDLASAFFKTCRILAKEKPDVVHTHLFEASLVGLAAAKFTGIPHRFYTRHHSDSNHVYVPAAVKYDRLINKLSTHIVAVSENVKNILTGKESVHPQKIAVIHHGLDFTEINNLPHKRIETLRQKYGIRDQSPVIGVISRYIHLKGVHHIVDALSDVLDKHPDALLVLVNTVGNYSDAIRKKLEDIPQKNYIEIEFEEDLFALYKLFDIYVHTPINGTCEAFGQTYIEALASRVPSVFTLSGIAAGYIIPGEHALVVPFENTQEISESIQKLVENTELCTRLINSGYSMVSEKFDIHEKIKQLEELYTDVVRKTGK
jgi:glycosyltransferase involved in cell wall biosynthesis